MNGNIDLNNVERYTIMAKKKKIEEEEFEKQLAEVEFTECDGGQSKRQNEIVDLLKQIVQLLTTLKERFI